VPGYNYDVVSGVDYVVDLSMPRGSRIRQMVYRGKLVDPDDRFSLALSEHRRVGSGGYSMLSRLPVIRRDDRKIRDLLIAEATRVGTLDSSSYFTPNWQITPPHAAKAVVAEFGGARLVERTVLRVLATADFYGSLEPRVTEWSGGRQVGGAAALEAQVDSIAADCNCPAIVVDAGNHLRGSLTADLSHGKAVVEAFNTIGYDVTSIGAQDLSWGVDTLRARVAESRYRWLSANARLISRNGTPDWAEEWVMLERGGLRVAVVGVTMTNFSAMPGVADDDAFGFGDGVGAVRRLLPQIRGAGANHVIVVAHADVECDESSCKGALVRLAEGLDVGSVDLIIGGHTDTEATAVINGIPILLPGSYGLSMGVADFVARPDGRSDVRNRVETVWGDALEVDGPFVDPAVGPAVEPGPSASRTLATLKFAVPFDAAAESPMGRLVADAYRHAARAHIGLAMHDGIAHGLSAGPVAIEQLYRVLPEQHAIARVTVKGSDLMAALEWALESGAPRVSVSGINVWYDPEEPVGSRVQRVRFTDDRDVEADREYLVAVSAPMTWDKSQFPSLSGAEAEDVGATDLDALADYLGRLRQPVAPPARERYHAN
jgi:2',3'-cyclic-nucleotide 2'-phosphodiesterase (5'-nucleotidase family)